MKKVYVLTSKIVYEHIEVIHGVYSNLEYAQEGIKKITKEYPELYYGFEIEESLFIK